MALFIQPYFATRLLKRLKNLERIERFKREIEAIRNLSHENIVRLIDFDLESSKPYLVMEYCTGRSLAQVEPFWLISPTKTFEVFQQICEGVLYAHRQNIIHRDLKPDNIFLRTKDGPAVVGDFGICYFTETEDRLTLTEEAVGPRFFMAPELEDGRLKDISPKSDVYSLGKILYWLFSGGKIFSREKHRDINFDLKGYNLDTVLGWDNVYLEHVNRLLDLMIVSNPQDRADLDNILILSRKAIRLVEKEFTPIDKDIKQPCKYCGYGYYVMRVEDNGDVSSFGFTPYGGSDWRILVCNRCGHVQIFRLDKAEKPSWWNKK